MEVNRILMFLVLFTTLYLAHAQLGRGFPGERDEILDLPGMPPSVGFRQYSGYLKASDARFLHYWFVESASSPSSDPLVLWLNGGPGCSSMEGFLTENGPFRVTEDGKSLFMNPYSWNKRANMLFLESPAGVGFSYSSDGNITTSDDLTAEGNYNALVDFMNKFPQFCHREFYITGESYAGIYVPTLAVRVMEDKNFGFKGVAIGNAVLRWEFLSDSKLKYFYHFGLMGTTIYHSMVDACCNVNQRDCFFFPFPNKECERAVGRAYIEILKPPINPYNVHASCEGLEATPVKMEYQRKKTAKMMNLMIKTAMNTFSDDDIKQEIFKINAADESNPPCTVEDNVAKWLNNRAVKRALNIKRGIPEWTLCSARLDSNTYIQQYEDMEPFIRKILSEKNNRVMIFNGDLDSQCDFFGDQRFVDNLNLEQRKAHQKWHYTSDTDGSRQVGGFAKHFDKLTFLTVRGAGHMVPTDKPEAAYEMFSRFLQNQDFE